MQIEIVHKSVSVAIASGPTIARPKKATQIASPNSNTTEIQRARWNGRIRQANHLAFGSQPKTSTDIHKFISQTMAEWADTTYAPIIIAQARGADGSAFCMCSKTLLTICFVHQIPLGVRILSRVPAHICSPSIAV